MKVIIPINNIVVHIRILKTTHKLAPSKGSMPVPIMNGMSIAINSKINSFNKIVAVERNIRNVMVDGVPLKGKIDKMEFDGHFVNVVDYKTGNPDNAIKKLKNPELDPPNGGDYWRQAVFYKVLIDNSEQGKYQVRSTEFDFIEPNAKKEIKSQKLEITREDTDQLRAQVVEVWEKIQSREFYKGCGEEDCHWCNFVKTNKLEIQEEEDELN